MTIKFGGYWQIQETRPYESNEPNRNQGRSNLDIKACSAHTLTDSGGLFSYCGLQGSLLAKTTLQILFEERSFYQKWWLHWHFIKTNLIDTNSRLQSSVYTHRVWVFVRFLNSEYPVQGRESNSMLNTIVFDIKLDVTN